jgi:PKD repeat protein
MAYDPADKYVVLFGGYNASTGNDYNDTWTYSHGNWTRLNTSNAPSPRRGAAMAYDAADGYLVLFGGVDVYNLCCDQDTWTFKAGIWTDLTSNSTNASNSPGARYLSGLAYDTADQYLVLYGGCSAIGCSSSWNDTWKFAAGNWTLINDNGTNPGDRGGEALVWYPPAHALFMFGGANPGGGANNRHDNDSWEFSGGNWTHLSTPVNPGARGDAWMVYDPVEHYIVLFGGLYDFSYGGNGPINDTWLYLSTGWINETANLTVAPPARWTLENAGAWDAADGYPLLFSGRTPSGVDLADTWTYNWTLRATLLASRPGIDQNQSVELVTNASGGTFSYSFAYGNVPAACRVSNASSIPCTFNATGSFAVNVTVTDSAGARVVANYTIRVFSDPSANLTVAPAVVDLGQTVRYFVNVTGGSGGVNYTYRTLPPGCTGRSVATLNCTPSAAGTFSSSARIVDRAGVIATTSNLTITVDPRPTVQALAGPTTGVVPLAVNFSAMAMGGTRPVGYTWSFGDGSANASTANTSHVYGSVGHFIAMVTATDSRGDVAIARVAITVLAPLAVTTIAFPTSGAAPLFTNFSTLPTGGLPPYAFLWTFGDGSSSSTLSDPSHVYTTAGSFNATVTVTDSANHVTSAGVSVLVVRPMSVAPTANRTAGEVPFAVNFGATIVGGLGPFTYLWSFDDGTTSTLASPSHTFRTAGQFRVTGTVSDALGEQLRPTLLIEAVSPIAVTLAPPSTVVTVGQLVNLSVTTRGGSGTVTFSWSGLPVGCASVNDSVLSCRTSAVGNSTVNVLAQDSLGGRSNATARVEVDPLPPSSGSGSGASNLFASPLAWLAIAAVVILAAVVVVVLARRRPPGPPEADGQSAGPDVRVESEGEVVSNG